jgi:hypothetical protein
MIFCSPCFSLTKPQSFADCVGDELPLGWEQVIDYSRGVYYINHVESKCSRSLGFKLLIVVAGSAWIRFELGLRDPNPYWECESLSGSRNKEIYQN